MLISNENIKGFTSLKKAITELHTQMLKDIQIIKNDIDEMKGSLVQLQTHSELIEKLSQKIDNIING
jgi:hypothetical protein